MSFIKDIISQKYIKQSFKKANSLFYGEIVGEGKPISGFQNTVNVRIFNGNSILQKGQSGEILQNVPFLSSSSTISVNWKEGDTVVIGYLNSDGNSPYIVSSNFISNVSINSQGNASGEVNNRVDFESGVAGKGDYIDIPKDYGTVETYEKEIITSENSETHGWAKSSNQGQLRLKAIPTGRLKKGKIHELTNAALCDNRLLIATKPNIGGNFPVAIGDYLDVVFSDNSVWNCILGDTKGADAPHPWGHNNGASVVEIIYWDYSDAKNYSKKINRIIKVGNFYEQ